MGAPVRDSIKLNTMGELHLVSPVEPPPFPVSLDFSTLFPRELVGAGGYDLVIVEFVRFVGGSLRYSISRSGTGGSPRVNACTYTRFRKCNSLPSSVLRAR